MKPQPLQPEAKPYDACIHDKPLGTHCRACVADCIREASVHGEGLIIAINGHGSENYWSGNGLAALLRALLATIEEDRREQPVRNDALADECAKASYELYDDGQDDYSDLFRRAAKALRDPHTVSLPANAREQPVRVTDADEAGRGFAKDYSEANFSTPEEREAHRLTAIDGFDQGVQYCRSRDDYPALAAAPKEGPQVVGGAVGERFRDFLGVPRKVSSSCALCGCPPNFDIHDPHFGGTHSYLAEAPKEGRE